MALRTTIKQNENLVRIGSALALAALAVRSFATGHRLRGVAAAGGAVAVGATASTLDPTPLTVEDVEDDDASEAIQDAGPTPAASELRCGVCEEPIVAGESRRPDDRGDIVHQACL